MSREFDDITERVADMSLDAKGVKDRIANVSCALSTIMDSCREPALWVLQEYLLTTVQLAMNMENKANELRGRIDLMNDESKKGEAKSKTLEEAKNDNAE